MSRLHTPLPPPLRVPQVRSRSRRVGLVFGLFSESEEAEARIWWLSFIAGCIIVLPFCNEQGLWAVIVL